MARALATYWRTEHLYPARTLRFVIFDAEEQGVYGSFHYLNSTINGDTDNVVAMFNEEQSGIAYPLRYLGKTSNPLLPFYAYLSPLVNSQLYPNQGQLPTADLQRVNQFRQLMGEAVAPVFAAFQSLGYQSLIYHGNNGAPSPSRYLRRIRPAMCSCWTIPSGVATRSPLPWQGYLRPCL